jgi:hypothetical protein
MLLLSADEGLKVAAIGQRVGCQCQDQFGIPQNDQVENPQIKRSVREWSG